MDGDRELTIWLAETFGIPLDYCDCGGHGLLKSGAAWEPLHSLDDARLLEDRLRELGMHYRYSNELQDETFEREFDDSDELNLIYATARQRCEAVRRTWLARKESEGT